MNLKSFILPLASILILNACKKDPAVTNPVKFTSTKYQTLGYNPSGKPNFLLKDTISSNLLAFIHTMLPDAVNLTITHPELFSTSAIADIKITQTSDVYITFVTENTSLTNSIAFYTYPSNKPPLSAKDIKLITYVLPSAGSNTPLVPGDKIKIGKFEPGNSIGFVLMQDAWDGSKGMPDNDAVHLCSNDALNPEVDPKLKKHAVLIDYTPENKIIVGFEDTNRTYPSCDNDFNDVTFYVTVVHS
ncbi:MAG: DUF4114 domain-containing protein [Ginsengibacter sp.]